jgi:hypothetical protein
MSATALQSDAVWLNASNYRVAPLNAKVADRVPELTNALQAGVVAFPDTNRSDFYDIELAQGWAYIHVHDDKRTVYLVAYSRL